MSRLIFLFLPLFIFSFLPLYSTTIHVPGEEPTIQAGIDATSTRDTVLVASGVYTGFGNKNIDFNGKAIVVLTCPNF